MLAAGGGRVAQVLRSNVGPASKPLDKVVKPKQEPPLQKQDDVAALLSRVGALEGQVLALRTAKKAEAPPTQPRPPPPADPDRPVPQSKALGALAVVVGEQMSTETDRLRAENERLREEMARLVLRGVLPPPPRAPRHLHRNRRGASGPRATSPSPRMMKVATSRTMRTRASCFETRRAALGVDARADAGRRRASGRADARRRAGGRGCADTGRRAGGGRRGAGRARPRRRRRRRAPPACRPW